MAVDGRCGAVHAVVSLKPSTLPAFFSSQRRRRPADGFIYLMIVFLRLNVAPLPQTEAFGRDSLIVNQQEKKN